MIIKKNENEYESKNSEAEGSSTEGKYVAQKEAYGSSKKP